MELSFTGMTKTGEMIVQFPYVSQILDRYQIDICCSSDQPISEAIKENNLNEKEVLGLINQLFLDSMRNKNRSKECSSYTTSELIKYIVENHHNYLYKTLPELSRLTAKIARVHGKKHPELHQVYHLYNNLKIEIEQHVIQEEELIFPLIEQYEKQPSKQMKKRLISSISTLEEEHQTNTENLKVIREVTNNFRLTTDACLTFQLTFLKLQELEIDLTEHMYLESDILLPKINI